MLPVKQWTITLYIVTAQVKSQHYDFRLEHRLFTNIGQCCKKRVDEGAVFVCFSYYHDKIALRSEMMESLDILPHFLAPAVASSQWQQMYLSKDLRREREITDLLGSSLATFRAS